MYDQTSLATLVLALLLEKPGTAKELYGRITAEQRACSIQAVYLALRSLLAQDIIFKRNMMYYINDTWRRERIAALQGSISHLHLAPGESFTIKTHSFDAYDTQWRNVVLPLHDLYAKTPVFYSEQHDIWSHLGAKRSSMQETYLSSFTKNKQHAFLCIGGSSVVDKIVQKNLSSDYMHITTGKHLFSLRDGFTILGDHIITTRFSKKDSLEIDAAYTAALSPEEIQGFLENLNKRASMTLIVEHNHTKAVTYRKKLAKFFYIPEEIRNQSILWE